MKNYNKSQPQTIKALFNNIAQCYDLTNLVISFNMHNRWNRTVARYATQQHSSSFTMLDLCAGTGAVAFECLKKASLPCQAYLLDFSPNMLEIAKRKAEKLALSEYHHLEYLEADAQSIPLPAKSIDFSTIAYGIRNIQNPAQCFQEVYRILKPGGCFAILELTRPRNRFLKFGHHIYLSTALPILGKMFAKDKQAYEYLCQSIHTFISPEEMENLLKQKGFNKTKTIPLMGGIATIILGYKE